MKSIFSATLFVFALFAAGCASHQMMMSDHSTMSSDGSMMIMNSDGTTRAMTEQEMNDHMMMVQHDSRFSKMMMDECKSMGSMNSGSSMPSSTSMPESMPMSGDMSGEGMMVMNADGTTRAMTDAEYKAHVQMMMKNADMKQMMMSKCSGM
ncbi:MAG: hypothetical protein ABI718_05445 [Acidobacteriota bacterium]